jgi:hypothetical protein
MNQNLSFTPAGTVSRAVTGTTANVAVSKGSRAQTVMVQSLAGNAIAFIKFGASTVEAAATDTPILPGQTLFLTVGNDVTHMAAIGTMSTTLYVTSGNGD